MGKRSDAKYTRWCGSVAVLQVILAVASSCVISAHAADPGEDSGAEVAARQAPRHHSGSSLDDRVRILAKALDLDPKQQSELRQLLEAQREQVRKVWSDTSLPAANRISATRAISDKTADHIRALLSEEQQKKYNPRGQPHDAAPDSSSRTVEDWMQAAGPK